MPLPSIIEIIPPEKAPRARVKIPGSKSITNRALLLAVLKPGVTVLEGALWSEDTEAMTACLQKLGFSIDVASDPSEPCNRRITVQGRGAKFEGGTEGSPVELHVGNAGTAARFLAAFVCLGSGWFRLSGVPRMHERPQAELFSALRQLGYQVKSANDRLPVLIRGAGPRRGQCEVSIKSSSQFASALLLSAAAGQWEVQVQGENSEEGPYVAMTRELIDDFASSGPFFQIEPDASSASYFVAADYLLSQNFHSTGTGAVQLESPPATGWQVDARFARYLPLPEILSRSADLGDSIMTSMILAPFSSHAVRFTDLGRLRLQECERVAAMRKELSRCGASVHEEGDTLTILPSRGNLHGAEIETYNDHRMAMCFAVLGLVVPGIRILNPACVKKTFPNFFQKLALPNPDGLGTSIKEPRTGRGLAPGELFAD